VFERFTDGARRSVVLAQEEARLQYQPYIGTEHLLLGLIHEDKGVAAKALASLDIMLEAVRQQVEQIVGHAEDAPKGHVPFTPRAKKALELSSREALLLSHDYVGTEHILLGLVREGEGVAAQVLLKLGADLSRVRQVVIQLLADEPESGGGGLPRREFREFAGDVPWDRGHDVRFQPATRKDRFLWACQRRVPNFMVGWPTWFRNRRAVGLRGDLVNLKESLFRRHRDSD